MSDTGGFWHSVCGSFVKAALLALIPAFLIGSNFHALSREPLSKLMGMLLFLPTNLLRFLPHELGHNIVGFITDSHEAMAFGGTGLELGLPLLLCLMVVCRGETLLSWIFMLWTGYVMINVAHYWAASSNPLLLKLGIAEVPGYSPAEAMSMRDWIYMLTHFGVLSQAMDLGRKLYMFGLWLLWVPVIMLLSDFLHSTIYHFTKKDTEAA
ncbi:MAG: hypothetical protein GX410_00685 [Elusimicrobia bacterium]|nr:hypothetical protein [Elusimicrobiota bacterium]